MTELQDQFVSESRELIQQATDDLLAVERSGFDAARIDRIFRTFHTLKGSAGVVELPAMAVVLHAAEDVLTAVNAKRRPVTTELVNEALRCLDQVLAWVNIFELRGTLPDDAGEAARKAASRLRLLLGADEASLDSLETADTPVPEWLTKLQTTIAHLPDENLPPLLALSYSPLPGCFFNGDDPLQLAAAIPNLAAINIEARETWPKLAEIDPFNCNLNIYVIAAATRAELRQVFRLVPDQVRIFDLPHTPATSFLANIISQQVWLLELTSSGSGFHGRVVSAAQVVANALSHQRRPELGSHVELALATALAGQDAGPLVLEFRSILDAVSKTADVAGLESENAAEVHRSLRVDESRIDALFNLSGEMIIAKNALAHLSRRMEMALADPDLVREVRTANEGLSRLTAEMHASILQLRMVPVSHLLRKFPRLVRDIALRLGKHVELTTEGAGAECDKNIVDRLFEPLLHLLRNALDHGIETPEERKAAGKPETANLAIRAARNGDRLSIAIEDDGRGIDADLVRSKAGERGLLPANEIDALSDQQAIELVFMSGLSTAANVSDLSGRGVGMDVVRSTVEQIGGRINLTSGAGVGTTVRLDLPISIAMSQIMVVEAGGQPFGILMDAVVETVRLTPDRIRKFKTNRGFALRDRVIPICTLAELLDMPAPAARDGTNLLIVAEAAGRIAALEVDAIRDRVDAVLKPMQGVLANAKFCSGTTMTADGRVLLVLDLKEILP